MTKRNILLILCLLLISGLRIHADEIKKRQSELLKLKNDIDKYEDKIKEKERKEHANLELLDTYDHQASLIRKLIGTLKDQQKDLEGQIDETRRSVNDLSGQLSFLKRNYARYVTSAYKYGKTYDIELLIASHSVNQLLIRSEYLRRFSQQRKNDVDRISDKRENLQGQNLLLQQQLVEQRQLISDKAQEDNKLTQKMKKRKTVLADIRRDKKNYQREMSRKIEAMKDLEQIIAKLVEEERARKEREARARERKGTAPPREIDRGTVFDGKKGRLLWPVGQGKVVAHFGNQQHPVLRTVTQNTGIDIAVPSGTSVNSVAGGEVSKIYWLPSFGNLVILNHNNGFLTVYAHLSEIQVAENQKISEGERIGSSGESLSGPMLHFEIYRGREKLDPEQWLRPRGLSQR